MRTLTQDGPTRVRKTHEGRTSALGQVRRQASVLQTYTTALLLVCASFRENYMI